MISVFTPAMPKNRKLKVAFDASPINVASSGSSRFSGEQVDDGGMQPLRFYHVNYNVVNRVDGKMDSKSVRVYDFKVRV